MAIIPENDAGDIEELMRKVGGIDEENVMLGKLSKSSRILFLCLRTIICDKTEGQTSIKSVEAMLRTYYDLRASPTQAALAKLESYASETQV